MIPAKKKSKKASTTAKNTFEPIKISNIIIAVMAVIGAGVGWFSSYQALKLNTAAFETAYRPYMGVFEINSNTTGIKPEDLVWHITIEYKNFGNIPAQNIKVLLDSSTKIKKAPQPQGPTILFPDQILEYKLVAGRYSGADLILQGFIELTMEIAFYYEGLNGKEYYTKQTYIFNHIGRGFNQVSGSAN